MDIKSIHQSYSKSLERVARNFHVILIIIEWSAK